MATRKGLYDKKEQSEAIKSALEEISVNVNDTNLSDKLKEMVGDTTKKPLEIVQKFLAMNDEDKNKLAYDHEFKLLLNALEDISGKLGSAMGSMNNIIDGIQTKEHATDEERDKGIDFAERVINTIREVNTSETLNKDNLMDDSLRARIVSGLNTLDYGVFESALQELTDNIDNGTLEEQEDNADILDNLKDIRDIIRNRSRETYFKVGKSALTSPEFKNKYVEIETLKKRSQELEDTIRNVNKEINNIKMDRIVQGIKNVWGFAKKLADEWIKFNDLTFKLGRQMGMTYKQLQGMQTNFMRQTAELARLYGLTREELLKFQESYTSVTGRAVILSKAEVENMAALSKLVDETTMNDLVDNFDKFGTSTEVAMAYLEATQERAMRLGLNASKAASVFAKNMNLASKFTFREGVNGVSKMVMLSQKLRMNMESIASAAEKFETIEDAITTSANLQVLGGQYANLFSNPLQVMFEATSDFESFQERIANVWGEKGTFNKRTGTVEISPIDKRMIKESAKSLGISYEEALTIAQRNVSSKYIESQLNNANSFTEEQKTAITNLAKYDARSGKHYITTVNENGDETNVKVSDLTPEALEKAMIQANEQNDIDKNVWDISKNVKQLTRNARIRGNSQKTFKEELVGGAESFKANIALNEDFIMKEVNHFAKSVNTFDSAIGKLLYSQGAAGAFMIGGGILSAFGGFKGAARWAKGTNAYKNLHNRWNGLSSNKKLAIKGVGAAALLGTLAYGGYQLYKSRQQFDNNLNGNYSIQQQEQDRVNEFENLRSEVARQTAVDAEGNGLLTSIAENTGMSAKLLELQAIEGGSPVREASVGGGNFVSDAIGAAVAGGMVGSVAGPIGAAVGAIAGALVGGVPSYFMNDDNEKKIQEENARREVKRQQMLETLRSSSNSYYNSSNSNAQTVIIKADRATIQNDSVVDKNESTSNSNIKSNNHRNTSIARSNITSSNESKTVHANNFFNESITTSPNLSVTLEGVQRLNVAPKEIYYSNVVSKPTVGSENTVISSQTYWNNLASSNKNNSTLSFKDNKISVDVNGTIKMQGANGQSFDISQLSPKQKSDITEVVLRYINQSLHGGGLLIDNDNITKNAIR